MAGGYPQGLEVCNPSDSGQTSGAPSSTVTCGTSSTYGSWVQVFSSTANDTEWLTLKSFFPSSFANNINLQIGVGGAGSETPIVSNVHQGFAADNGAVLVDIPLSIPAGTRVSCRGWCDGGTGEVVTFMINLWDGGFFETEGCAGLEDVTGSASGGGTAVTSGAGAGTKGSYAQVVASSTRDYLGVIVDLHGAGGATAAATVWDIAVGAAASEQNIATNLWVSSATQQADRHGRYTFWTPIPSGTRISARVADTVGSTGHNLHVYGMF